MKRVRIPSKQLSVIRISSAAIYLRVMPSLRAFNVQLTRRRSSLIPQLRKPVSLTKHFRYDTSRCRLAMRFFAFHASPNIHETRKFYNSPNGRPVRGRSGGSRKVLPTKVTLNLGQVHPENRNETIAYRFVSSRVTTRISAKESRNDDADNVKMK